MPDKGGGFWTAHTDSIQKQYSQFWQSFWNWSSVVWPASSWLFCFCCSVPKSCPTLCDPMICSTPGLPVSHRLLEFAQVHVHWVDDAIPSSTVRFSFCLQSFPVSRSLPMSRLFASGGQSIGTLGSASVLPMSIYGWFPLGLTGLISLQSKGLYRVFSSTIVWKHQFFGTQSSLWSNSRIHVWLLERP